MDKLLAVADPDLVRAVETTPPVVSTDDLSADARQAMAPLTGQSVPAIPPIEYSLPERTSVSTIARTAGDAVYRLLLRLFPRSSRARLERRRQARQAIVEAEARYAWLKAARQYVRPAVECLQDAHGALSSFVRSLDTGIEAATDLLARREQTIVELMKEREALRTDAESAEVRAELVALAGEEAADGCLRRACEQHEQATLTIATYWAGVQYVKEEPAFYREREQACRNTLRALREAIGTAQQQLRDIDRTIQVYELPTRAEAEATMAIAFLDRVDEVTDELKQSIGAINRNLYTVAGGYSAGRVDYAYDSPVPPDIGMAPAPAVLLPAGADDSGGRPTADRETGEVTER